MQVSALIFALPLSTAMASTGHVPTHASQLTQASAFTTAFAMKSPSCSLYYRIFLPRSHENSSVNKPPKTAMFIISRGKNRHPRREESQNLREIRSRKFPAMSNICIKIFMLKNAEKKP
jgi:hypothetical protein